MKQKPSFWPSMIAAAGFLTLCGALTIGVPGFARDPEPVREESLLVSVRAFGAVGDGRHDDRDAVLRALRSGHAIFFPKGTYVIGSSIDFGALRLADGW